MAEENELDNPDCLACPLCGHGPPAEIEAEADLILAGSLSPFLIRCEACGLDYNPMEPSACAL